MRRIREELAELEALRDRAARAGSAMTPSEKRSRSPAARAEFALDLGEIAGRLGHLGSQIDDGGGGNGAETEQDAPGQGLSPIPDDSSTSATSGPTMRPSACIEKTRPTRRPRSWRFEYSLMNTAETG